MTTAEAGAAGVHPDSLTITQNEQEVSVDQLQVGFVVRIGNTLDDAYTVEGTVLSVPKKAPDGEAPAYLGSVLILQHGLIESTYPDGHSKAGQPTLRQKPTLVVPPGEYNDLTRPTTNKDGKRSPYSVGRYQFFLLGSEAR